MTDTGFPVGPSGKAWPKARDEDVCSIEALVSAFDEALSFEAGKLDKSMARLMSLFLPTANVTSTHPWNLATDAEGFARFFVDTIPAIGGDVTGFSERNTIVRQLSIGDVHSVYTYYTLHMPPDNPEPAGKGINFLHVVKLNGRYWIASCVWEDESDNAPTPPELIPR